MRPSAYTVLSLKHRTRALTNVQTEQIHMDSVNARTHAQVCPIKSTRKATRANARLNVTICNITFFNCFYYYLLLVRLDISIY